MTMPAPLAIDTESPRSFRLAGELDISTVDDLADAIAGAVVEDGDLVLDLAKLTFVDSSGVRLFLQVLQMLEGRGRLILRSPTEQVEMLVRLMGLQRVDGLVLVTG